MDNYHQALANFHKSTKPDVFEIVRDDGFSSVVPVSMFFDDLNFPEVESLALSNCNGRILDVGAGVGRHSSELQRRGFDITAVDVSKQAVEIMKERGIKKTINADIMNVSNSTYDTVLMLMNGIGLAGSPEKLDKVLLKTSDLLTENGIILIDSIDVNKAIDPKHIKYREENIAVHNYPGQQNLRIDYDGATGAWFKWLHVTFNELSAHAKKNNFIPELLKMEESGHYLAKLQKCS